MTPLRLVVDTDVGTDVDDAVALALLLTTPGVAVQAVSTVSGDTRLRATIAATLASLAGQPAVSCAAGLSEPRGDGRSFLWLGHEGRGILGSSTATPASADAVDTLCDRLRRDRPAVLAIGPLTNLAAAFTRDPGVADSVSGLTVMGGVLGLRPGLPAIEYNLCSDPDAAAVVLGAGIPTTLVPLDVTMRLFWTDADIAVLRRSRSPLVRVLCEAVDVWKPYLRAFLAGQPGYPSDVAVILHDPLAALVLLEPSLVSREALRLRATIRDGLLRLEADAAAPVIDVVVDLDVVRCKAFLLDHFARLG